MKIYGKKDDAGMVTDSFETGSKLRTATLQHCTRNFLDKIRIFDNEGVSQITVDGKWMEKDDKLVIGPSFGDSSRTFLQISLYSLPFSKW